MVDPSRPERRRLPGLPARSAVHFAVVALVAGSAMLGVLTAQGVINLDGSAIRVVPYARAGVNEAAAAARDEAVSFELQPSAPETSAGGGAVGDPVADVMAPAVPTPEPAPVAAIPLPAPPPVRSGTVGASYPWSGPTGYVQGDGSLLWPVPGGYISQYFWSGHLAIDIAHAAGGPVLAADTGTVTQAGWMNNGGGLVVMIQHADGRVTGYNHLGSILVSVGQGVTRGSQIATVGCTGLCTGPHVHFQVIINGVLVNPLRYL